VPTCRGLELRCASDEQHKLRSKQPKQTNVQSRCVELLVSRDVIRHTFLMVVIKLSHGNADPAFATHALRVGQKVGTLRCTHTQLIEGALRQRGSSMQGGYSSAAVLDE
jgi:hypothetical protein